MENKRIGKQTVTFPSKPCLNAGAAVVGKLEGEGPLAAYFDKIIPDEFNGQTTFEQAEKQLYLDALSLCMEKANVRAEDVEFLLGGDLLNQIISASFSARDLGVPFLGLYGACSTMAESLSLGAMLIDGGFARALLCAASSHFCTAERQYRFPLEFGSQRTPTAQWTVTGAGATFVCDKQTERTLARVTHACVGRVLDLGVTDANNMGAAMAPAATDTLLAFLRDTRSSPESYDLILTGDLGQVGSDLLMELMAQKDVALSRDNYQDCGLMIFESKKQDMHAGGSGCGCGASVLNGCILPRMRSGELKRVLFMATGALLSPTSSQQGESIPGIAHLVALEAP